MMLLIMTAMIVCDELQHCPCAGIENNIAADVALRCNSHSSLCYSVGNSRRIDANNEEEAEAQAWAQIEADNGEATRYGEWDIVEIEEGAA